MQTDKDIRAPFVCRLRDSQALSVRIIAAPFARWRKIIALHQLAFASCKLKIMLDECADVCSDITLTQAAIRIDRTAVIFHIVTWIQKDFHSAIPSFLCFAYGDISKIDFSMSFTASS